METKTKIPEVFVDILSQLLVSQL